MRISSVGFLFLCQFFSLFKLVDILCGNETKRIRDDFCLSKCSTKNDEIRFLKDCGKSPDLFPFRCKAKQYEKHSSIKESKGNNFDGP